MKMMNDEKNVKMPVLFLSTLPQNLSHLPKSSVPVPVETAPMLSHDAMLS